MKQDTYAHGGNPSILLSPGQAKARFGSLDEWAIRWMDHLDRYFSSNYRASTLRGKMDMAENVRLGRYAESDPAEFIQWFQYAADLNADEILRSNGADLPPAPTAQGPSESAKKSPNFPINLHHYDQVTPKKWLLLGEAAARPFNYTVVNRSATASKRHSQQKTEVVRQLLMRELMTKGLGTPPDQALQPQAPDGAVLESAGAIDEWFSTSYTDFNERCASDMLKFLEYDLNLSDVFQDGMSWYLDTGVEIYHVSRAESNLSVRAVNPLMVDFDLNEDDRFLDETSAVREIRYMNLSQVMEEFWPYLTKDDILRIEQGEAGRWVFDDPAWSFHNRLYALDGVFGVQVAMYEWTVVTKIGLLSYTDENGSRRADVVDEEYEPAPGEEVEWKYVPVRWAATRIGRDIVLNAAPIEDQMYSLSSLGKTTSRYVGVRDPLSFVGKIKPYQFLYNIFANQLNLEVVRSKGKVLTIDLAQIPTAGGWTPERWITMLTTVGIAVTDSSQAVLDGTPVGAPIQSMDMTLGNTIQYYLAAMQFCSQKIDDVTGITPQRQGSIQTHETASGVERSVRQSSAITEPIFSAHSSVMRRTVQTLLNTAKHAFSVGDRRQMVLDDATRIAFEVLDQSFKYEDLGVFATNSTTDAANLQLLKQAAQQMFGAEKMDFLDLARVTRSQSVTEIVAIAESANKRRQQEMQQQIQMQSQANMQEKQLEQQGDLRKTMLEIAGRETVARIGAFKDIARNRLDAQIDQDGDGSVDIAEKELQMEERKLEQTDKKLALEERKTAVEEQTAGSEQQQNPQPQ